MKVQVCDSHVTVTMCRVQSEREGVGGREGKRGREGERGGRGGERETDPQAHMTPAALSPPGSDVMGRWGAGR